MQQRSLTILVSIIIVLSLLAIGIFYLSDPTLKKPSILSRATKVKKDLSGFYPLAGERIETSGSSTYRFIASSTLFKESVVDFSGRSFKDYLKLVRLVDAPIAGAAFLGSGSSSNLFYLDGVSGQINLVDFQSKLTRVFSLASQKNTYDVLWGKDDTNILFISRIIRNGNPVIYTGATPITTSENGNPVSGTTIGKDIRATAVAPNKKEIFYLEADSDSYVVGNIANFNFGSKKQIYSSPLAEWNISWPEANTIALQTKAAASVPGYLYFLNPATKQTRRIIGDKQGLTTLTSPNAKLVLLSQSVGTGYTTELLNIAANNIVPISLRALPDKCVWTSDSTILYCAVPAVVPAGEYPDMWYRSEVNFNDSLWKITVDTGKTELLNSPSESLINEEIDATNLFLDPNQSRLFFTNKRDRSFWMLDLEHNY